MTKREAKKIAARELHDLIDTASAYDDYSDDDYRYTDEENDLIREEFVQLSVRLLKILSNIQYPKPRVNNKSKLGKPRKSDDIFNRMNHNIQTLREVLHTAPQQDSD